MRSIINSIMPKKEKKPSPSSLASFPTFRYSPGDTVVVSLDSKSGSRGREVIVQKITPCFTAFTNGHKCKHEHVLRAPLQNAHILEPARIPPPVRRTPPPARTPPPRPPQNARTPPNENISRPSLDALKANLLSMQDEMGEITYLMRRLQKRMTDTDELIEDFKAFEDFKQTTRHLTSENKH